MCRYNVLRLGKFATFLTLMLLWASAAPIDARVECDNGIVRVKSAVPNSETIMRIKADIATWGWRRISISLPCLISQAPCWSTSQSGAPSQCMQSGLHNRPFRQ